MSELQWEHRQSEYQDYGRAQFKELKIMRDTNKSLPEIEQWVHGVLKTQGQMLMRAALTDHPLAVCDKPYPCPSCQKPLRIQERSQQRTLPTSFGPVSYERPYGVCDRCGFTCAPMDALLAIPRLGPTLSVREKICRASVAAQSFKVAADLLAALCGITLAPKRLRVVSEGEGKVLLKGRAKRLERFEATKIVEGEEPMASQELLVIACDGGRVQTREGFQECPSKKQQRQHPPALDQRGGNDDPARLERKERWKEDKIGVIYEADPVPQPHAAHGNYQGAQARTKTFVATMEPWESFGWMLRLEAGARGYLKAKVKLFLADGARHIRELKNLQFPEATFILDWAHAAQHLADCAKAAFGEGTQEAQNGYEAYKEMLWEGKRDEIIAELQKHSQRLGAPEKGEPDASPRKLLHQNAYSYFPNNRDAMDYPAFRAKGWPIGSGVAEGAVKQFAKRLKGSEKFWNVCNMGAEEMLALCALYFSEDGRWDEHWRRRRDPKQRE